MWTQPVHLGCSGRSRAKALSARACSGKSQDNAMPSWTGLTKSLLGHMPYAPELYDRFFRQHFQQTNRYNLTRLEKNLPSLCDQAASMALQAPGGKRVFIFASIFYWIEQCAVIGLALKGLGHQVTLGYYPYSDYRKRSSRFDQRYFSYFTRNVLKRCVGVMETVDLLEVPYALQLPDELQRAVDTISLYDSQYVLHTEEIQPQSNFYRMRHAYNDLTARTTLTWLQSDPPDMIIIPNGIVIEYGVAYQVARFLGIPVVTFEFSEEHEQLWLAHDDEVMRQNTDALWLASCREPLQPEQRRKIEALENARRSARAYGKSERLWQDTPPQGKERLQEAIHLDDRPLALLAANVLGDSLVLGRNIFSQSMIEWIVRTVDYFAKRPDLQLLIRIHPGERYEKGPSMAELIRFKIPNLPENVHLVGALDPINTYDIMALARLGLVYTTTTGMEMVMHGIPVIVAGDTHYRRRGFTIDPQTWEAYFQAVADAFDQPGQLGPTPEQVNQAWNYAYRFFFQYPRPFPWHLVGFWESYQTWPLARVLGEEGQAKFGATFHSMVKEPIQWTDWELD
jgi:hypothetical protein